MEKSLIKLNVYIDCGQDILLRSLVQSLRCFSFFYLVFLNPLWRWELIKVILSEENLGIYFSSQYSLVQSQQWKHQNNLWNLFEMNKKNLKFDINDL